MIYILFGIAVGTNLLLAVALAQHHKRLADIEEEMSLRDAAIFESCKAYIDDLMRFQKMMHSN